MEYIKDDSISPNDWKFRVSDCWLKSVFSFLFLFLFFSMQC